MNKKQINNYLQLKIAIAIYHCEDAETTNRQDSEEITTDESIEYKMNMPKCRSHKIINPTEANLLKFAMSDEEDDTAYADDHSQ